ncbi:PQQ-dependent sugar dehydrogenase [Salinisphaera sp. T31B1]|uniref:PQQ-dependent sugar dehydrogenase n=1 Tax=Salinisphaera sp. T31B1 TaxID=727963 RepID=UPI0033419A1B
MKHLPFRILCGGTLLAAGTFAAVPAALAAEGCDTAGLALPDGFCATEFAADASQPRHLAVADNGVVYVNLATEVDGHALLALRDTDGDGVADTRKSFGQGGATGLTIHDGWLYAATLTDIYRYKLGESLVPEGEPEHLVSGLPQQSAHSARGLAVSDDGSLFVNIGAPSNACQAQDRSPGSKGQDPCPLLEEHGGIWRFSASDTGQKFSPDARFATGIRNMFALAWHDGQLYGAQHGRDQLHSNWPDEFTQEQSAHLPAEELFAVDEGDNFGWPFCYYDPKQKKKVLGPEYGGDGDKVGRCKNFEDPIAAYPAHWAPMAIQFSQGEGLGKGYADGAFIAFHGSWNRAPSPQAGYRVIFQPFADGKPSGDYKTFAGPKGFTGSDTIRSPGEAEHRPAGLAQAADGALYISDDAGSTIFRVTRGQAG